MSAFLQHDEPLKDGNDYASFLYLLRFAKPYRGQFAVALALLTAGGALGVFSIRTLGRLVDEVLRAGRGEILPYGLTILAFEFLVVVCAYYGRRAMAEAASKSLLLIREKLFARLDDLPMSYFDRQPVGRIVTRLTYDVEGLEDFFSGTLARMLSALITLTVTIVGMAVADARLSLVLVGSLIPSVIATYAVRGPVRHWNREFARRNSAINARLNEFLNGIPVIRAFGVEAWSQREFDATVQHHLKAAIMTNTTNAWSRPLILILCMAPLLTLLAWGGPQLTAGALSVGLFVAFVRYCERLSRPIANIAQEIHTIQAAFTSAERVAVFLKEGDESAVLGPDGALPANELRGEIEFRNVSMGYSPNHPVLSDVSFHIPAGARVGLAGTTGSGKTTTVALIARLYEYQLGEILADGRPLRSYKRSSLRDRLGFVSQDVVIFKGTVRENLLCGVSSTDERVREACRDTGLARVLERSGLNLDSELLDKGMNLSLGERQLLALTRILLRDPAVLVLDEATANIDPDFERLVSEAVEKVMRGRTCILIAHRLATLRDCDCILVFRGGRLIEQGNHESLVASNGYYAGLVRGSLDGTLESAAPRN
jgi:ABC-type multidrug transport system fused ATPase/permease subunit